MIPRISFHNPIYTHKNIENLTPVPKTHVQIGKRTQSLEQKTVLQDKRMSVAMKNTRTSFGNAHKANTKKYPIKPKTDQYDFVRDGDIKLAMPALSDHTKNQTQPRQSVTNKRDNKSLFTSAESFLTRFSTQTDFPKLRPQLTLHKGNSHVNIPTVQSTKNKILQPARSSTFTLGNRTATYAVNTTNGLIRNYNEDRVSIVVNIKRKPGWTSWPNCSYFAVFDGHGGSVCADFLKDHLHQYILEHPKFPAEPIKALKEGCERAEVEFCALALKQTNVDRSGSCALILLFVDDMLYVSNIGDCRAIVSENDGKNIQALTRDHKPEDPHEQERILKNGGQVSKSSLWQHHRLAEHLKERMVELPYRVYPGGLSVSRSFGDVTAKNTEFGGNPHVLVATPDIKTYKLEPNKTDFIIVGCKLTR